MSGKYEALVADFADTLRELRVSSRPMTRVADYMLRVDLNEMWRYARENPDSVTRVPA